jgi:hypothetical protein
VAARIRRELGIEVQEQAGAYGEFTVLVDGKSVLRGNPMATMFAVLPPAGDVVALVREHLARPVP